ncbi:MAG TPA: hypothetical protein DCY79_24365 [Planctomycetaceae bacterium]|nr:hypothetical protein [Planctomycetaceae bacterium]
MRIHAYPLVICLLCLSLIPNHLAADAPLKLGNQDVVVFLGGTNMLRIQQAGILESLLTRAAAPERPMFRDLAWEADTVFQQGTVVERWRRKAHFGDLGGLGDLHEQLSNLKATVVVAQFGQLESLATASDLPRFTTAYQALVDTLQQNGRQVILVTPHRFESPPTPLIPDLTQHNTDLAKYVEAIVGIANARDLRCVDLFTSFKGGQTENGMHLRPAAHPAVAIEVAGQLGIQRQPPAALEPLRRAVVEKHRLWYDYWRPANWKLIYGDDAKRVFTRGGDNHISFQQEWRQLLPKIAQAEQRVWQIARGEADPGDNRPAPENLHGDPSADVEKELASFTVPEGLQVNLFASERHGLTSPLAVRWDPAGRMYVTVTTTYPHVFPGDLPNDKIILLEDTNHDGRADKSTVFADHLNIPTGIEWGDGGIYVGQNTELLFLKDTDGDGRADERRVVLSGFGNGDSHQTINSFAWSPDGELHFGHGDGCESRVETPWGASNLFNAGFYRFTPKRLHLIPYLEGHMGPGNPWGVAFDNWGQIFNVDGAGGVNWLSAALVSTTHRRRLPRIGDPGGYCGIGYLDGPHLPESMQGEFAIGDYKSNRVKRFSLESAGAGFRLKWKEPLLQSSHRNFRPIDVRVGPDGAVYVVDWYNPITCHQDDAYRDPTRDKAHGRIWRITSTRDTPAPVNLATASPSELASALASDQRWIRYQAKRAMTTRDRDAVKTAVTTWVRSLDPKHPRYEHHLFEALSACATVEAVHPGLLNRLLQTSDPRARAFATRIVGRWYDRLPDPLDLLAQRVADAHPRVRMEALVALSSIPHPNSITIATRVLDHPRDSWIDYVFAQTVHRLKPWWLPALQQGQLSFQRSHHLAAVLNEAGSREVIEPLKQLLARPELKPDARVAAINTLLAVGDADDLYQFGLRRETFTRANEYDHAAHATVLATLAKVTQERQTRPAGELAPSLTALLEDTHPELRARALELIGLWKVEKLSGDVLATCRDAEAPDRVRRAAILALSTMQHPQAKPTLESLADAPHKTAIRSAAIQGLAAIDSNDAAQRAVALCATTGTQPIDLPSLLAALLNQQGGAAALANALQQQTLPAETAKQVLLTLFASGRADQALLAALNPSLGAVTQPPKYSPAHVQQLVTAAAKQGDAQRGAVVFQSMACRTCHKIGGTGGQIGPDLTALGTTLSPARITEEVLWPSRQIKEGFSLITVLTDEGKIHQGYERTTQASEADAEVWVEDLVTRKVAKIPKSRIEEKRIGASAMPTGITSLLSDAQLVDLLRYLTDLGKVR